MSKWIKNNSGSLKTWVGQQIVDQAYYEIQSHEESTFANDSTLLTDIGSSNAIIAKDDSGNTNISDVNEAINYLKDNLSSHVEVDGSPAFSAKTLTNGKKLYTRTHGKSFAVSIGVNTLDFDIPYAECKINGIEVINGEVGDNVDLFILDDDSGTYSTVPNYVLNQFGFDANIAPTFYNHKSNYDADLFLNMCVSITYYSESAKTVYINYLLHEVKD